MAKPIRFLVREVQEGRFLHLLLVLLGFVLFFPFLKSYVGIRLLYIFFLTVILLASIYAVRTSKAQSVIGISLALPMIIFIWVGYAWPSRLLSLCTNFAILFFLAYIIVSILRFVFTTRKVTRHVIYAAVSAYILIGIAWSIVYTVLELFAPESFSHSPGPYADNPTLFLYFSFVTITTLGYGDILPLTPKAQALAVSEAMVGQIYMTVLIAWLVGLYVSRKVSGTESGHDLGP